METVNLPTGNLNDSIPRVIHQTWKVSQVPEKLAPLQKSWTEHHPKWQYRFWNDQELAQFIETTYPWFWPFYQSYPHPIQKVDAARYFIMYTYGGVYADLDMQCLTSLDPLIEQVGGVIVGQEGQVHSDGTQRIGNALIASSPRHPFWLQVFQGLLESHAKSDPRKIGSVFTTTGPSFLHEVYVRYPAGVTVMPVSAFYPMAWHEPQEELTLVTRRQYPKSFTCHHWDGSWRSAPRQVHVEWEDNKHRLKMVFLLPRKKADGYGVIEQSLSHGRIHRETLLERWSQILQEGDNVIQVGAYNGYLTVPLAMMVGPTGQIYAFEADSRARQILAEVVRLNNLSNVYIYDSVPTGQMIRCYRVNKFNPLKPHRMVWRSNQVSALDIAVGCPLDAILLQNVTLIHIDANGEEIPTLMGADQIIKRDRPFLTMEILSDQKRAEFNSPNRQDQSFTMLTRLHYNFLPIESSTYLATPEELDQ